MGSLRQFETFNFFMKRFYNYKKAQNANKQTKIKYASKKHLRRQIVTYLLICLFAWVYLCHLVLSGLIVLLVLLVCAKSFRKKNNKEFKTALMTSIALLLIVIKNEIYRYTIFSWSGILIKRLVTSKKTYVEQVVPWNSGNYRVWIHLSKRTSM